LHAQFQAAAAATKTLPQLDNLVRTVWRAYGAGHLDDAEAQSVADAITARRAALRAPPARPVIPRPVAPRSPDRQASIERRRRTAAGGWLPPAIAAKFTVGEQAVLAVVGREVQQHGTCSLPIDALAGISGTSRSTVKRALRQAVTLGLITLQERRRAGRKSLTNVVKVISAEWLLWIKRRHVPAGARAAALQPLQQIGVQKRMSAGTRGFS
jgi:hypothetical protein